MLTFQCLPFEELSLYQLYEIMARRQEVFVVEQHCTYVDADGLDLHAWHLMGMNTAGKIAAYARLLPLGIPYEGHTSIGRVITSADVRGTGAGKALLREALAAVEQIYGPHPIQISAQTYLLRFYRSFGFVERGEVYLEDGIPHIHMIRG